MNTPWEQFKACECGAKAGKPCLDKRTGAELKHAHRKRELSGFFSDVEAEQADWEGK